MVNMPLCLFVSYCVTDYYTLILIHIKITKTMEDKHRILLSQFSEYLHNTYHVRYLNYGNKEATWPDTEIETCK